MRQWFGASDFAARKCSTNHAFSLFRASNHSLQPCFFSIIQALVLRNLQQHCTQLLGLLEEFSRTEQQQLSPSLVGCQTARTVSLVLPLTKHDFLKWILEPHTFLMPVLLERSCVYGRGQPGLSPRMNNLRLSLKFNLAAFESEK